MKRATSLLAGISLIVALSPSLATADHAAAPYKPGAAGVGDRYFPLDGNGGYDVKRYNLRLSYHPATDRIDGVAHIRARATQDLSRFNLDLDGLVVESIRVRGRAADWSRHRGELIITPHHGLPRGVRFTTRVAYHGVPRLFDSQSLGLGGFFHTFDGAFVAGQPHAASAWFPANDHPTDKASYTFHVTAPRELRVIANGRLTGHRVHGDLGTWTWVNGQPMASYLATVAIGHYKVRAYTRNGLRFFDAIDAELLRPFAPRTGTSFAMSQRDEQSYKRLTRSIDVPAGGGRLSFWIYRNTEPAWDFTFVEAHTAGMTDWTTLRDRNGHTSRSVGYACPYWLSLHPFLRHYQSEQPTGCSATGSTGKWWAASGHSNGWEHWSLDLSRYAGTSVRVSISYASDDAVQMPGAFVDDVRGPRGQGTTSFEDDGNTMDGWVVSGAPTGSVPNDNDWTVGTAADAPRTTGSIARQAMAREPEIISFLSRKFGPYPWHDVGGIVPLDNRLGFALETQTRPVYAEGFFSDLGSGTNVLVHELAHQWYGDSLAVRRWRNIWLNEGFASYAEWLWSQHEGDGTPQQIFDFLYGAIPADDSFWALRIGDPGPVELFAGPVYTRGAMTLQQLRVKVGDRAFFRIMRTWARRHANGNVATWQFVQLAERISGQHLIRFFDRWLYTAGKPAIPAAARVTTDGALPASTVLRLETQLHRHLAQR